MLKWISDNSNFPGTWKYCKIINFDSPGTWKYWKWTYFWLPVSLEILEIQVFGVLGAWKYWISRYLGSWVPGNIGSPDIWGPGSHYLPLCGVLGILNLQTKHIGYHKPPKGDRSEGFPYKF